MYLHLVDVYDKEKYHRWIIWAICLVSNKTKLPPAYVSCLCGTPMEALPVFRRKHNHVVLLEILATYKT